MTQSRRHLYFILFVVLLEVIGFGIIIPIFPSLLMELGATDLSNAAIIGGYLIFIYAIMMFFAAPIIGALSDQFGRRPVILISLLVYVFDYILLVYAPTLIWLVIGRIIGGIAGGVISTAHAYVTDISSEENRATYFGMLGAAIGLGFILGPALGGFLGEIDVRLPFKVAAGVMGITLVIGYFLLPESLGEDKRRKFELKRANPIGTLAQMFNYKGVILLLVIMFFLEMALQVYPATWTFFTIYQFDWSVKEVSYSLAFYGLLMVIVQGGLVGPISKKIGDVKMAYLGLIVEIGSFIALAFIVEAWVIYMLMPLMAFGGLSNIGVRTILSKKVPDNAQGELQGAITSAISIVAFTSPLIMTQAFGYFSKETAYVHLPGAAFLVAAIFAVIATLLFVKYNSRNKE